MLLPLLPVVIIVVFAFYITYNSTTQRETGAILNVTMSRQGKEDPRTLKIVGAFKKMNLCFHIAMLLIWLLALAFTKADVLFFMVWLVAVSLGGYLPFAVCSRRLVALKEQENWYPHDKNVIRVDLIVSREKAKMPIPKIWFLPAFLISAALLALAIYSRIYLTSALHAVGFTLLYFGTRAVTARERTEVYSKDTEVNLAMTQVSIRGWSKCWTILANITALIILSAVLLVHYSALDTDIFVYFIYGEAILPLIAVAYTALAVQRKQKKLIVGADADLAIDTDHYWSGPLGGLFYNNPNDSRIIVKKRIGIGYTFNLATTVGKIVHHALVALGVGVILFTIALFVGMEITNFKMAVSPTQVEIKAPLYSYSFLIGDLESVYLVNELPPGVRTNGAATNKYLLGNFDLANYGDSKIYVYKGLPPYIVMELPDLYVFFNCKVKEDTLEHYDLLLRYLAW